MQITGRGLGPNATVNGVSIKNGKRKYNFDIKDPLTAFQLDVLKKSGLIKFQEGISPELLEATTTALNDGTLEIATEGRAYKGSALPVVEVEAPVVVKDVGEPTKTVRRTRKNDDRDKGRG